MYHITMKSLLVCSLLSLSSADPQVLLGGVGYPYALGSALTYTPHVIKPVVKEIEVPVKTITYGIKETGCKNVFGFPVPCLAEGEAHRKRAADEEAAPAAPAVLPFPYAGFGYAGLAGYPYAGFPYAGLPAVKVAEPTVTEVEVPHYVYKPVEEKIELAPLCHNGAGFAVPCA